MTFSPHRAALAGEGHGAPPLVSDERILRERARRLAGERHDDGPVAEQAGREMLVCRLHDETYAIELAKLSAVQSVRGLTPIPCTPPFVAGVLNVRGTVVTVLDLARGLGLTGAPPPAEAIVLLTDSTGAGGRGLVGLLVHEVVGVQWLSLDALTPAFSGNPAVRGIIPAGIVVLDLALLLADGRFEVVEEW